MSGKVKKIETVFWVGPVVDQAEVGGLLAVSPAGNKWQGSFIQSLECNNIETEVFSYLPVPMFPRGPLVSRYIGNRRCQKNYRYANFFNIPIVRNKSLGNSLLRQLRSAGRKPDVLFSYNDYPSHSLAIRQFLKGSSTFWVNIVAENNGSEYSDLNVYLSYQSYVNSQANLKFHLDGGVYGTPSLNLNGLSDGIRTLLFAGSLNEWSGIFDLVELVSKGGFEDFPSIRLKVFGKGDVDRLLVSAAGHPQIEIFGFVDEETLTREMTRCWAFINPRTTSKKGSETNFPSKLFDYLLYGRPIICCDSPGLAECYKSRLLIYHDRDSLRQVLACLLAEDDRGYDKLCVKHHELAKGLNWDKRVCDLLRFIKSNSSFD